MQSKIGQLQILVDAVFVLGASRVYRTYLKEKARFHVEMAAWKAKSFMRQMKTLIAQSEIIHVRSEKQTKQVCLAPTRTTVGPQMRWAFVTAGLRRLGLQWLTTAG